MSNFLVRKSWSNEKTREQRARFVRIGIVMLFAFGSCLSAWLVEVQRLKLINKLGITDNQVMPMKMIWLAPQFGLLGIPNWLGGKGTYNFFNDRVPNLVLFKILLIQIWYCLGFCVDVGIVMNLVILI